MNRFRKLKSVFIEVIFRYLSVSKTLKMLTLDLIIEEMKDVPANRLEELSQFVHSLTQHSDKSKEKRKKILSYSGLLSDLNNKDYNDFSAHIKRTRESMFDRDIDL